MPPGRGNARGRGGRGGWSGFKSNPRNDNNSSVTDRLGRIPVYPTKNNQIDKNRKKYKFVKEPAITSSIATLPAESKIRMLARKFIQNYYDIFDQPGRTDLESQYSFDAFFSFSATSPMPTIGRNLLMLEPQNRLALLFHNKTKIAETLVSFPPTEHLIVVTGVFKDNSQTVNPLRAFTRVFVLKQASVDKQGDPAYEIFNDIFMLQPPTPDQIKKYHQDIQIAKRLSSATPAKSSSNNASTSQEAMITSIMAKTKMNREGSRRLLQDSSWDEAESMETFNGLYAMNKIPQEFFTP